MEHFTEEHSKLLLSKEWLVKIDAQSSTPYLIKFCSSLADLSCCLLVTDNKTTWAEVLNAKEFARRWRDCNRFSQPPYANAEDEDSWRKRNLEVLSKAHTLGGIKDLGFELVGSHYADLAFELECETFKWRWEVVFVGFKLSSEILSKHLIAPLVSVAYLAFSSADPIRDLPESELEKIVDKMARTARRTLDTHIKHAISKPRVATTIQRVTAMFNFASDPPPIISTAETPDLGAPTQLPPSLESPLSKHPSISPSSKPKPNASGTAQTDHAGDTRCESVPVAQTDSATESENEDVPTIFNKGKERAITNQLSPPDDPSQLQNTVLSSLPVSKSQSESKTLESDPESPSPRPAKKARPPGSSSDDDSEAERKKRVAMLKGAREVKRGTKQPIKRGAKRF